MPSPKPRSRARAGLLRIAIAVALGAVLWWLGFAVVALAIVVAAIVLTAASWAWPAGSGRIEAVLRRFGHTVGRALTLVLLTAVNLLVFTPVAIVMRVVGHDPLAPGTRRTDASFWHPRRARSMPERQFADERALFARIGEAKHRRRPILRLATAVGVVVLILAADLGAGWVYDQVSDASRSPAAAADDSMAIEDQPALQDSPWARDFVAEQNQLVATPDTYLGYRYADFRGRYLTLVNGVRRSYQPAGGGRLKVWFFGGSALFGDIQRDEHTIPSEVARIAEADGLPIEVRNYGRPATSTWMELGLLEELIAKAGKPDVVVFYDGFNDLAWQLNIRLSPDPYNPFDGSSSASDAAALPSSNPPAEPAVKRKPAPASDDDGGTSVSDVISAYWDQAASHRVYDAISDLVDPPGKQPVRFAKGVEEHHTSSAPASPESVQAGQNAASIEKRAAMLVTALGRAHGFRPLFFYQPTVFTKRLLADEERYRALPSYEPERWDPATQEARNLLKATPYIDLGRSLDGMTRPVLSDFVHINEDGAHRVAEAMYEHLRAQLQKADESRNASR
ncbi:MAG: hypothetical protein WD271_10670 [Acidimicrobiia bacterium]